MPIRLILTVTIVAAAFFVLALYDASLVTPPPPPKAVVVLAPLPPPPEPAPEAMPALPQVALKDVPVHAVPEDTYAPGDRKSDGTLHDRNVSDEVANGPRTMPTLPIPPKQLSGSASVAGATMLQIGTTKIVLFGIKPALPTDRCGLGTDRGCLDTAMANLKTAVTGGKTVSCRSPNQSPGAVVANAICLSPEGIDLGGALVSAGFALADTGQSYDYVGAESIARGQKRGLWANR